MKTGGLKRALIVLMAALLCLWPAAAFADGEVTGSFGVKDTIPPAKITLSAAGRDCTSVELTWTSPGDDGDTGTAASYDIRYATAAIGSETAWKAAATVPNIPAPQPAGSPESLKVDNLASNTSYYFAIRAADAGGNWSALSNSPGATTSCGGGGGGGGVAPTTEAPPPPETTSTPPEVTTTPESTTTTEPVPPPSSPPPPPPPTTAAAAPPLDITCPAPLTFQAEPGECYASGVTLEAPRIGHHQGAFVITNDAPATFPVGETIVTWSVTDTQGNSSACTQRVTVTAVDRYVDVDLLGGTGRIELGCPDNVAAAPFNLADPSGRVSLGISQDTRISSGDGGAASPGLITVSPVDSAPPTPGDMALASPVYRFEGYLGRDTSRPAGEVTFDRPVTMRINYDPGSLPTGASSPAIAYYDTERQTWSRLVGIPGRTAELGTADGLTDHFSLFAVVVTMPERFTASDLNIIPGTRKIHLLGITVAEKIGESAVVTAAITGRSGMQGDCSIGLDIDGQSRPPVIVSLVPGQRRKISFAISGNLAGRHIVSVAGLTGEFVTQTKVNWWPVGGAGLVLAGCLAGYLLRRRRIQEGRR